MEVPIMLFQRLGYQFQDTTLFLSQNDLIIIRPFTWLAFEGFISFNVDLLYFTPRFMHFSWWLLDRSISDHLLLVEVRDSRVFHSRQLFNFIVVESLGGVVLSVLALCYCGPCQVTRKISLKQSSHCDSEILIAIILWDKFHLRNS